MFDAAALLGNLTAAAAAAAAVAAAAGMGSGGACGFAREGSREAASAGGNAGFLGGGSLSGIVTLASSSDDSIPLILGKARSGLRYAASFEAGSRGGRALMHAHVGWIV